MDHFRQPCFYLDLSYFRHPFRMTSRLQTISGQVTPAPNDPVIVLALRTPLTRGRRGPLATATIEDLLTPLFKAVASKINPADIGDILIGNCLAPGSAQLSVRMASLMAGIPNSVPCASLNRQCSSGLQTVASVAAAISAGLYEVGLAGGVESMSGYSMADMIKPDLLSDAIFEHEGAKSVMIPMGITSENVATQFGISREKQDAMAAASHAKAAKAQTAGLFDSEIVPVVFKDSKSGKEVRVSKDDGIRKETTPQSLASLNPAFKAGASTTAGNSSQTSDGAAVVLLVSRAYAQKHRIPILARIASYAVIGCAPEIMGIGPAIAIPKALGRIGLGVGDIDIFEINEAFASQATYCVEQLKIPVEKLNPKGGAIALGHPLGCTGAKLTATLLHEMKRREVEYGIVSMCIGGGMGAAGIFKRG